MMRDAVRVPAAPISVAVYDSLTMNPAARRKVVRMLARFDAAEESRAKEGSSR